MIAVHRTPARRPFVSLAVAALVLAACSDGRSDGDVDNGQTTLAQDTSGMMSGMQDMGRGGSIEQMQAHLHLMDGADADSMQAMMVTHRQLVTSMLGQFETDMRGRNVPDSTRWDATVDSVRQDLEQMPQMRVSEQEQLMAAHVARLRRLMDAHATMVGSPNR